MKYKLKDIKDSKKQLHSWTYVLLLQYPTIFLTYLFANFTNFTPNIVSLLGIIPCIISGYYFFQQNLLLGALFFLFAWLFDAVDGRLARAKGLGSKYGAFFDNYIGGIGFIFMLVGFAYGVAQIYNNLVWFVICFVVYFLIKLRSTSSLKFKTLVGDEVYKEKVGSMYKKNQSILAKIVLWFSKRGMVEPFNLIDVLIIIFLIGPIVEFFSILQFFTIMHGIIIELSDSITVDFSISSFFSD